MSRYEEHLAERESQEYASTRRWNPHPNVAGMIGEREVARFFDIEQDLRNFPGGDGGIDIQILLNIRDIERWISIDAKANTYNGKDACLLVSPDKVNTKTIYVCIYVIEAKKSGDLLGWMWGQRVAAAPLKDYGHGPCHAYPVEALEPMHKLFNRFLDVRLKPREAK